MLLQLTSDQELLRETTARFLDETVPPSELRRLRRQNHDDLDQFALVSVDEGVSEAAAEIAEQLGVRSLDAIHLGSAQRLMVPTLTFLTFDLRQAQAARSLGFAVLGV